MLNVLPVQVHYEDCTLHNTFAILDDGSVRTSLTTPEDLPAHTM